MHPNATSILMLADIRHRELQDEAARLWFSREARGGGVLPLGSAAHRLRAACIRAWQLLPDYKFTRTLTGRQAQAN